MDDIWDVKGPRLEFETLLAQMVSRAEEMMVSQSRLRDLIRVNHAITSDLDLDSVLRRIVEMATELIDAEFAGMGVLGDDRRIEKFIHSGIDAETEAAIGRQPEGKGLLGAIIDAARPVSLTALGDDPRSVGFPAGHPPMESFLGAQIRVRDEIYGNLYLANSRSGTFSPDDVELAEALAATAGIAIENARQFDESVRRERWSRELAEAARGVMMDDEGEHIPQLLKRVRGVLEAEMAVVCTIDPVADELVVEEEVGDHTPALAHARIRAVDKSFAPCLDGDAVVLNRVRLVLDNAEAEEPTLANLVVVPFAKSTGQRTVLCVANLEAGAVFGDRDVQVVQSFTSHLGVIMDRAEVRRTRQRVVMLEDRNRIARDLHDHVIQRLFATGLSLQATASQVDGPAGGRLSDLVHEIDGAITQIRQSIFALNHDSERSGSTPRSRIVSIVERLGEHLARRPTIVFAGPIDLLTDDELSHDVEAVISEALTNAVRHAEARSIDIEVAVSEGSISVSVTDDGVGPGPMSRRSGLSNLEMRARKHDGEFSIVARPEGGTALSWSGRIGSPPAARPPRAAGGAGR
ncbi:GAF domain-containing protein [Aeromicrobium sp. Leaf350]|uniref:sensor histidine kinase n=1 Tax=Aeromicrobium sp. Leaf350 TaxID=2876565 RepID=UPI001E4E2A2B|nr:GAF domain-containing protein [Aeromicrobium sp. Leaf350]